MKVFDCVALTVLFASTAFLVACGGSGGSAPPAPPPAPPQSVACPGCSIQSVNHVIIMIQENRSFDNYFGQMTAYRQANNIPINSSDGKINDLSAGQFSNTNFTLNQVIPSHHTGSVCTEDLTPDWSESHKMMNAKDPASAGPGSPMDGFVQQAFGISQFALTLNPPITLADQTGARAMGFFDSGDLNYYYFLASDFAMGDAFYSPVPSRTAVNRLFLNAATSQGFAHEPSKPCGGTGQPPCQLTAKTIWQELDAASVSWKIYLSDPAQNFSYALFFTYFNNPTVAAHIVPVSQYFTDLTNGTLPSVSLIEAGQFSGRDEHPGNFNPRASGQPVDQINVQFGATYVSTLMNAFMKSTAYNDGVFFFGYDEGGALFDHVPPVNVPSPDGIKPMDLRPNDVPGLDFTITGFRIPNFIISPWARKNFVSHTAMDYTAILRFIETRWSLPALTARDTAMPDMQEFFDWTGKPWATPPTPPVQNSTGVCNFKAQ